jgi:4-amino-4-deoxy-L-arabinose transferase-like glycosyltransferase
MPGFFRSVLDWDESLYFLMAAQWRAGHLPYTVIWDNKPAGIYAIFALFQDLAGARVAAIRIAGVVFISVTAYALRWVAAIIAEDKGAGLLAGFAYIVGSLSNDGLSANSEPFMAAFTVLAVLVALAEGPAIPLALLAGLLAGAAFMVKYVAIFEDPAILFLILVRRPRRLWPAATLALLAGAAIPLATTVCTYWQAGQLPLWWDDSVASNFRRAQKTVSAGTLAYAARIELLRWGPLFLAGVLLLGGAAAAALRMWQRRPRTGDGKLVFLGIWLIGGCLGVAAAKSFFDHYFLQLLPALCVALGWLWCRAAPALRPGLNPVFIVAALALPCLAAGVAGRDALGPVLALQQGRIILRPDTPARLAAAMAPVLAAAPAARIYVLDDQPIIYALVQRDPPTKYVFPSVLTTVFLAKVAGVDAPAEVARILATRPMFIIRRVHPPAGENPFNPAVYAEVDAALTAHYYLWDKDAGSEVFRLDN